MDGNQFKTTFDQVASRNGFEAAFSGWFRESAECVVVLDLQRSNFGNYYELNIKVFIHELFGEHHARSKELVKRRIGDVFARHPSAYNDVLDLDFPMDDARRVERLGKLFSAYIVPLVDKVCTRKGILRLAQSGEITLLPAVRQKLESTR